jgi:arginine deiminase
LRDRVLPLKKTIEGTNLLILSHKKLLLMQSSQVMDFYIVIPLPKHYYTEDKSLVLSNSIQLEDLLILKKKGETPLKPLW